MSTGKGHGDGKAHSAGAVGAGAVRADLARARPLPCISSQRCLRPAVSDGFAATSTRSDGDDTHPQRDAVNTAGSGPDAHPDSDAHPDTDEPDAGGPADPVSSFLAQPLTSARWFGDNGSRPGNQHHQYNRHYHGRARHVRHLHDRHC